MILLLTLLHGTAAAEQQQVTDAIRLAFFTDVATLLNSHCVKCHGADKQESELQLTTLEGLLTGGASGAAIQPGRPQESLLVQLIRPDSDPHMPPKSQLNENEIAKIEAWVRSLPEDLTVGSEHIHAASGEHWAFRTPVRPPVPHVEQQQWVRTPIDAFIFSRLQDAGISPSRPAAPGQLIRRAAFDLTGLPPLQADVEAFEQQTLHNPDDAWCSLVERLLASPHYGERWGRHWLDLARYADSNGFEFDFERPYAWHYRDWVIDCFNDDQPYDQFLTEQLAGDEIAPGNFKAHVATGFCRNGPTVGNQTLEKHRWDELDDVISTTSEVFLGLTLGCARCHDHKYDPISQREYYSLLAIFNNLAKRQPLIGTPEEQQQWTQLDTEIGQLRKKIGEIKEEPSAGDWQIENGELLQQRLAPDVRLIFGDPEWTDYTVEVEVLKTGGTSGSLLYDAGISLAFRATDTDQFYWLRIGVSDNREYSLAIVDNGDRTPVTRRIAGTVESDRWYQLRVTVQGTSIRVWIDNQPAFDVQHRRYRKGGIGLGNWLATSRWRNLVVRDMDGTILLAGFPNPANAISPKYLAGKETADDLNERIRNLKAEAALLPFAMSIADEGRQPRETRLFHRGDHRTPGPVVQPAVPTALSAIPIEFPDADANAGTTGRRSRFARWLTSPQNSLTARVMSNRIWQYHFGRGLVETSSNFGFNGARPSHSALLDWLAVEFIESGWSVKHMHRVIMASSVYQQSSARAQKLSPDTGVSPLRGLEADRDRNVNNPRSVDPENHLLWRFFGRRLESELIRDRILAASGSLNKSMHGPGIRPRIHPVIIATSTTRKWPTVEHENTEHWRRSVYIFVRRSVQMPMLEAFDSPTTTQSCECRLTTTVATQALQLMNDAFTNQQAAIMAGRVRTDSGHDNRRMITEIYWDSLARAPTESELSACLTFLNQQQEYHQNQFDDETSAELNALTDLCHVMFNLNEFIYID